MQYRLRTLLIVLALGPIAAACEASGADRVDAQRVKEIVTLIESMPLWVFTPLVPDDSTPVAELAAALDRAERASRIEQAMEAVAKYRIDEIRSAVQQVAASRIESKDERLFVLNNFLFDIPEKVTSKSPAWKYVIAGYVPNPATDEDSTHSPWVARQNGTYRHATKAVGFTRFGRPYPAVEAFDAYQKHFGLRPTLIRQ
jgi:hypothetical protein